MDDSIGDSFSESEKGSPSIQFLTQGKMQRVNESQMHNVVAHWLAHSDGSWMKSEPVSDYLKSIF
jgi:hypothetical protein